MSNSIALKTKEQIANEEGLKEEAQKAVRLAGKESEGNNLAGIIKGSIQEKGNVFELLKAKIYGNPDKSQELTKQNEDEREI